jgi:hypothetical protein
MNFKLSNIPKGYQTLKRSQPDDSLSVSFDGKFRSYFSFVDIGFIFALPCKREEEYGFFS